MTVDISTNVDTNQLDRLYGALADGGLVGEENNAKLLILSFISTRYLGQPISMLGVGPSSSGKSEVLKRVLNLLPEGTYRHHQSVSNMGLSQMPGLERKILAIDELGGLGKKDSEALEQAKSLLTEGRISRYIAESTKDGVGGREVRVDGPTSLWTTTTKLFTDHELNTRLFKYQSDESAEQTGKITKALFEEREETDYSPYVGYFRYLDDMFQRETVDIHREVLRREKLATELQEAREYMWYAYDEDKADKEDAKKRVKRLEDKQRAIEEKELSEWRDVEVVIPFGEELAQNLPKGVTRMRRDVQRLRDLIKAHAILNVESRSFDDEDRIYATIEDYAVVRGLLENIFAVAAEKAVTPAVRETVEAALRMNEAGTVLSSKNLAKELPMSERNASRRLTDAAASGYLVVEDENSRPKTYKLGEDLPQEESVLPTLSAEQVILSCTGNDACPMEGCEDCAKYVCPECGNWLDDDFDCLDCEIVKLEGNISDTRTPDSPSGGQPQNLPEYVPDRVSEVVSEDMSEVRSKSSSSHKTVHSGKSEARSRGGSNFDVRMSDIDLYANSATSDMSEDTTSDTRRTPNKKARKRRR